MDEYNDIIPEQNDEAANLADMMRPDGEMTGSMDNLLECSMTSTDLRSERRQFKRNRGIDQDELWTTVGRKGKRFARADEIDESIRIPEENIEVSITFAEKLPKQFKLAKTLKEQKIKDVVEVKYINAYKVIIRLSKEESADLLVASKIFNENGLRCQKVLDINQSYGVINRIDLDLNEEEILESLTCETLILGIKRLKRRNSLDGRWVESESVRICFKGDILPSHVHIYDTRITINPYIYPVTQCSRCWRYGHSSRTCSATKPICPKCSDYHQNCEKTEFTCNNCGGNHMALAKICPVFVKEKKIREVMAECNCTYYYRQALLIIKPRESTPPEKILPTPRGSTQRSATARKELQEQPSGSRIDNTTVTTYAEVTKVSETLPNGAKKKKRKTSLRNVETLDKNDNMEEVLETSEDDRRIPEREERADGNRSSKKKPISWSVLLKKLKEKILEVNISWEEKIRNCLSIMFKEALSFVVYHMSDWPFFNFMNNYG